MNFFGNKMDSIQLNPLTNVNDLQSFIDMHITQLQSLTESRDKTIQELNKIEVEREKLNNQLQILLSYHSFISMNGFEIINDVLKK